MLRLEHLLGRLNLLIARDSAVDHHFALATLFEIMDVGARADLKSDLLKELERHRTLLQAYRGHPRISETALDSVIDRIDRAYDRLNQTSGKAGQVLTANEWLMSIRSRINIPGGTCEFDLPAYYAWQQHTPAQRRADLSRWIDSLWPLDEALRTLLGLLRESGSLHRVLAPGGQFQQTLPPGKTYQLLRLRIDPSLDLVPEISGHRLMVSIRLMKPDPDGRLKSSGEDAVFDLALCG